MIYDEIFGRKYPVIGAVTTRQRGPVPILDIPMMSDERWHELERQQSAAKTAPEPKGVDDRFYV